jgi:hypothetical protein
MRGKRNEKRNCISRNQDVENKRGILYNDTIGQLKGM